MHSRQQLKLEGSNFTFSQNCGKLWELHSSLRQYIWEFFDMMALRIISYNEMGIFEVTFLNPDWNFRQ